MTSWQPIVTFSVIILHLSVVLREPWLLMLLTVVTVCLYDHSWLMWGVSGSQSIACECKSAGLKLKTWNHIHCSSMQLKSFTRVFSPALFIRLGLATSDWNGSKKDRKVSFDGVWWCSMMMTLMWRSWSDAGFHVDPSRLLCLSGLVRLWSQGADPFDEVILLFVYFMFTYMFIQGSLCCQWLHFHVIVERDRNQDSLFFLSVCVCLCPPPPAPYLSMHIDGGGAVVSQLTYISWACSSLISSGGNKCLGVVYRYIYVCEVVRACMSCKHIYTCVCVCPI